MAFIIKNQVLVKYEEEANITEILVPSYVKSIGEYAFHDCANLKTINIPYSVKKIPLNAFEGCINLKDFNLVDTEENYQ
ncbi:MAG: leucine-rich repeat protein [Oscillospiraceae bacterium]